MVAVNENVKLTVNGKPVPEHVLNNLNLTDNKNGTVLRDNTFIHAGQPAKGLHQ